jgi:CBS domain-containing protein
MNIGDIRTPHVVVTYPAQPLATAARLMREHQVGALVVLEPQDPDRRPLGMLTDRDIVRGQLACNADLYCLTVAEVMSKAPLCLGVDMSLSDGIDAMNARAVRRAPVTDRDGALVGIVTLDDLLPAVASELHELAELFKAQSQRGLAHQDKSS